MSAPQTYSELLTAVADWADRTDDGIETIAARCVGLAEARFNRVLRVPEMEDVQSSTTSSGTITLPTDLLQIRSVYLNGTVKTTLEQMSLGDLRDTYPTAATGTPQHFAIQSGSELLFGPAPSEDVSVIVNYYGKIPALSESEPTNWLLTSHPDVYLWGALAELHDLFHDESRADRYEAKLAGRLGELNLQARGKAHGSTPLIRRGSSASIRNIQA